MNPPDDQSADGRRFDDCWDLPDLVTALRQSRDELHNIRHLGQLRPPPSRPAVAAAVQGLTTALFPAHYGEDGLTLDTIDDFVATTLDAALKALGEQIWRSLPFESNARRDAADIHAEARDIVGKFAAAFPPLRGLLVSDLRAAYAGDPAATGYSEILLVYPGTTAIIHHRIAHLLHGLGARFLARLIADLAHSRTGIDIHPGASVGNSFFIDHGTGVVIGETVIIGDRVRLYQAVTLGARSFPADETGALVKGLPRHPIIEDDVVIYAGATVLGRITIGKGASIGGNVWLTTSVPAGAIVLQVRAESTGGKND